MHLPCPRLLSPNRKLQAGTRHHQPPIYHLHPSHRPLLLVVGRGRHALDLKCMRDDFHLILKLFNGHPGGHIVGALEGSLEQVDPRIVEQLARRLEHDACIPHPHIRLRITRPRRIPQIHSDSGRKCHQIVGKFELDDLADVAPDELRNGLAVEELAHGAEHKGDVATGISR